MFETQRNRSTPNWRPYGVPVEPKQTEQRIAPRFDVRVRVGYAVGAHRVLTSSSNISATGMLLEAGPCLVPGTELDFWVGLHPGQDRASRIRGRVEGVSQHAIRRTRVSFSPREGTDKLALDDFIRGFVVPALQKRWEDHRESSEKDSGRCALQLAEWMYATGHERQALELYRETLSRYPDNPAVWSAMVRRWLESPSRRGMVH